MARELTDKRVDRARVGEILSEPTVPGLEVRRGKRVTSWSVRIRKDGQQIRIPVGSGLTCDEARDRARELIQAPPEGAVTVEEMAENWLQSCGRQDVEEPRRTFEVRIYKWFGEDTYIDDISRRNIARWVQSMRDENLAPGSINKMLGVLKTAWRAGVADGLVSSIEPITLVRGGGTEKPREQIYTDDQIRALWNMPGTPGRAMRLILSTSLRSRTVIQLEWEWVDQKAKLLRIPSQVMKMDRAFEMPLTTTALEALGDPYGVFCFPGRGHAHLGITAIGQAVRKHVEKGLEIRAARRTIASWLASEGVALDVVEAMLAHKPRTTVGRHYAAGALTKQVRVALTKWENHLVKVIQQEKSK